MKRFITIIGTRNPSEDERHKLYVLAKNYHARGYTLRSGGAGGCDSVVNEFKNVEIIIPWNGFNGFKHDGERIFELSRLPNNDIAFDTAKKIHPAPEKLSQGALRLHARNVYQLTGAQGVNREQLSEKVIFVADEHKGRVKGGTATAVHLARKLNIKTFNIRNNV